jgi:hypothetical protein
MGSKPNYGNDLPSQGGTPSLCLGVSNSRKCRWCSAFSCFFQQMIFYDLSMSDYYCHFRVSLSPWIRAISHGFVVLFPMDTMVFQTFLILFCPWFSMVFLWFYYMSIWFSHRKTRENLLDNRGGALEGWLRLQLPSTVWKMDSMDLPWFTMIYLILESMVLWVGQLDDFVVWCCLDLIGFTIIDQLIREKFKPFRRGSAIRLDVPRNMFHSRDDPLQSAYVIWGAWWCMCISN